jgi:hypothetical protein
LSGLLPTLACVHHAKILSATAFRVILCNPDLWIQAPIDAQANVLLEVAAVLRSSEGAANFASMHSSGFLYLSALRLLTMPNLAEELYVPLCDALRAYLHWDASDSGLLFIRNLLLLPDAVTPALRLRLLRSVVLDQAVSNNPAFPLAFSPEWLLVLFASGSDEHLAALLLAVLQVAYVSKSPFALQFDALAGWARLDTILRERYIFSPRLYFALMSLSCHAPVLDAVDRDDFLDFAHVYTELHLVAVPDAFYLFLNLFSRLYVLSGDSDTLLLLLQFLQFTFRSSAAYRQLIALPRFASILGALAFERQEDSFLMDRVYSLLVRVLAQNVCSDQIQGMLSAVLEAWAPSAADSIRVDYQSRILTELLAILIDSVQDAEPARVPHMLAQVASALSLRAAVGEYFNENNYADRMRAFLDVILAAPAVTAGLLREVNALMLHGLSLYANATLPDPRRLAAVSLLLDYRAVFFAPANSDDQFYAGLLFQVYPLVLNDDRKLCDAAIAILRLLIRKKPREANALLVYRTAEVNINLLRNGFDRLLRDPLDFMNWSGGHVQAISAVFSNTVTRPYRRFEEARRKLRDDELRSQRALRAAKVEAALFVAAAPMPPAGPQLVAFATDTLRRLRVELQADLDDGSERAARCWRAVRKSVLGAGGTLGLPDPDSLAKWTVDDVEGPGRMRRRLRSNDSFFETYKALPVKEAIDDRLPVSRDAEAYYRTHGGAEAAEAATAAAIAAAAAVAEDASQPSERLLRSTEFAAVDGIDFEVIAAAVDEIPRLQVKLRDAGAILFKCNASVVNGMDCEPGIFVLAAQGAYFVVGYMLSPSGEVLDQLEAHREHPVRSWRYDELREVLRRRYLLRNVALELFSEFGESCLLVFNPKDRDRSARLFSQRGVALDVTTPGSGLVAAAAVAAAAAAAAFDFIGRPAAAAAAAAGAAAASGSGELPTDRWVRGEMSNFDYIMELNTRSGRSYNDMTQYPVFPWVLSDYTSEAIDLADERVYRDLSKPMGALSARRRDEFLDRYRSWTPEEMGDVPKFHYGTHYSSAGIVTHALIRVEPFTSHFLTLQGGRFDVADRAFFSIAESWESASGSGQRYSLGDVRELVPEFFYLPEVFRNDNAFVFGRRLTGDPVDTVLLPPWAHGSPEEFVRVHRRALESQYVSERLHLWIDLVFGARQRGPAAAEAVNVFYYLTYEGAVNLDEIREPALRAATVAQILNYGQTPTQIFKGPHPRRAVVTPSPPPGVQYGRVVDLGCPADSDPVFAPGPVTVLAWTPIGQASLAAAAAAAAAAQQQPQTVAFHRQSGQLVAALSSGSAISRVVGFIAAASGVSALLRTAKAGQQPVHITAPAAVVDGSLRFPYAPKRGPVATVHSGGIRLLRACPSGRFLVTAGQDDMLTAVYRCGDPVLLWMPVRGHMCELVDACFAESYGVLFSADSSGFVIAHDLRRRERVQFCRLSAPVRAIAAMPVTGDVVAVAVAEVGRCQFYAMDVNLRPLGPGPADLSLPPVTALATFRGSDYDFDWNLVVSGHDDGSLCFLRLTRCGPDAGFYLLHRVRASSARITSLAVSEDDALVLVGDADGHVRLFARFPEDDASMSPPSSASSSTASLPSVPMTRRGTIRRGSQAAVPPELS